MTSAEKRKKPKKQKRPDVLVIGNGNVARGNAITIIGNGNVIQGKSGSGSSPAGGAV